MPSSKQIFRKQFDQPYYWDSFYDRFKPSYNRLIRTTDKIIDRGIIIYSDIRSLDDDISIKHFRAAKHLAQVLHVKAFVGTTFNYKGVPIITIKVAGYEEMVAFFKKVLLEVINNDRSAWQQLVREKKYWKSKVKWHQPKLYPLIPDARVCASEAQRLEYKYFNNYLKDLLDKQTGRKEYKILSAMDKQVQHWIENERIKDLPLTLRNRALHRRYFNQASDS